MTGRLCDSVGGLRVDGSDPEDIKVSMGLLWLTAYDNQFLSKGVFDEAKAIHYHFSNHLSQAIIGRAR